ncbi:MAG: helix-turn-helix transcriptional regulator [Lachnospiraceae bacterium]|jgi:Predicted transcriptional regulators|nr:helix-turn-helix transcriptional regulator [Lachnospiraceae bacterium]
MVRGLGEKLQSQRMLHKLSQKEVASVLGVSPAVISNYENGERTPSVEILMSLASLYHCSTDYLLGLSKDKNDKLIDCSMLSDKQMLLLENFLASFQ